MASHDASVFCSKYRARSMPAWSGRIVPAHLFGLSRAWPVRVPSLGLPSGGRAAKRQAFRGPGVLGGRWAGGGKGSSGTLVGSCWATPSWSRARRLAALQPAERDSVFGVLASEHPPDPSPPRPWPLCGVV